MTWHKSFAILTLPPGNGVGNGVGGIMHTHGGASLPSPGKHGGSAIARYSPGMGGNGNGGNGGGGGGRGMVGGRPWQKMLEMSTNAFQTTNS